MTPKWAWGLAALLALGVGWALSPVLSLAALKDSQEGLSALFAQHPLRTGAVYFLVYLAVASLSLPGAALLTLAGGAVFGLGWGLLLVSFASSLGATVSFLAARWLLRDALEARFAQRLREINRGVAQDGAFYLFTLRLIPVVPFFVVNLVMGLTHMHTFTFYWVSQLGMLAGTAVYVNAGTQLAQLTSLRDVLSPGLLLSFALLGVFPWVAKKMVERVQGRKVYQRWAAMRPSQFDRNLVVIGAGAGGLVSAYMAAAVRAKVTLVEAHKMGGDCLNYGCVPSKALIKSAKVAHQMRHASQYGLSDASPKFSFKAVMARVQAVIGAIAPHDSVARYSGLGVEVLQGHAKILNPWTVEVALNDGGTQQLTTCNIIIATGARPWVPPFLADLKDGTDYVTSDTLWDTFAGLNEVPKRLVVLGGGPIGCELAQSLARLGSQVTLVELGDRLLPREDPEVSAHVQHTLAQEGVTVLTGHQALRYEKKSDTAKQTKGRDLFSGELFVTHDVPAPVAPPTGGVLVVAHAGQERRLPFEQLLCAVGRSARLQGYGLEALGIPTHHTVDTNAYLQTLYPNIYAVGDVAGPFQLTHAAAHQAWYATVNALFGEVKKFKVDHTVMPWTTFTDPEVARVGLNEQEARAQGIAHEVTRYDLDDLDRALADSEARGFVKVLTVPGKDRILGVTIVGIHAGDLLTEFVLAMRHGLGLNKILSTIHTYPTLAEANKYVAGAWKRAHQPERLLAWVARYHQWRRG